MCFGCVSGEGGREIWVLVKDTRQRRLCYLTV